MSDNLIQNFLIKSATYCPLFTLDTDLTLNTFDSHKTAQYFIYNRIAAIAKAYLSYEDNKLIELIDTQLIAEEMEKEALEWQFAKIAKHLSDKKTPVVVVKGLCLQSLYPQTSLRPFSDIDLYIKPSMIKPTLNCFKEMGYEVVVQRRRKTIISRSEVQMRFPGSSIGFDIHWDLKGTPAIRERLNFDLAELEPEIESFPDLGDSIRQFSPELSFVYLITHHILHHKFRGLIWLMDILLLLEHTNHFNWQKVKSLTRQIGLERPVHFYLKALNALDLWACPEDVVTELNPKSIRYHLVSSLYPPASIFRSGIQKQRMRRKLFREAFKYHTSSKILLLKQKMYSHIQKGNYS